MNEPIETDKDGNTLTLMDTMSAQEDIVEQLDGKMRSEQLRGYLQECLSPRERKSWCSAMASPVEDLCLSGRWPLVWGSAVLT